MQSAFKPTTTINCRGQLTDFSIPKIMGIINLTPDSFYSKSRFTGNDIVLDRVQQIIDEGGDMVDIGAYSSRPGAENIDVDTEWKRLAPVLEAIRHHYPDVIISIDTFRAEIAKKAISQFQVDIINDISTGSMDDQMFLTIAEYNVPYIMMHMQGNPQNMQQNPVYENIMKEIFLFFAQKVDQLNRLGVNDIIIDPGFGFGKTLDHNYEIMAKLDEFKIFDLPVLVGVSRKSMIYRLFQNTPEEALNGTTVLNTLALTKGADILRVHDVKEAAEMVKIHTKIKQVSN